MDENSRKHKNGPIGLTYCYSHVYIIEEWHKQYESGIKDIKIKTPFGYLDEFAIAELSKYGFDIKIDIQNSGGTLYKVNRNDY